MRKLLAFLFRYSPSLVIMAVLASAFNGVISTGLLGLVNRGLREAAEPSGAFLGGFLALCALLPLSRVASQILLAYLTQKALYDLRIRLSQNILAAPMLKLEEIGPNRLLAALTGDVRSMSTALSNIPFFCMNLTIIACCLGYVFYLHVWIGVALVTVLTISVALLKLGAAKMGRAFGAAREIQDVMYKHFRSITDGAKEYKLHRERRNLFLDSQMPDAANQFKGHNMTASGWFAGLGSVIQVAFFVLLGLLVFVAPNNFQGIDSHTVVSSVTAMLFLWGPFDRLSTSLRTLIPAVVALRKIQTLGISLKKATTAETEKGGANPEWRSLELRGVTHAYHREKEDQSFTMGPLDLRFQPGDITFIIGGNGSGKTTLAKLITGLYTPESGQLLFDGEPVDNANRDAFRQQFAAVFSDFYLFDEVIGVADKVDDHAAEYLAKLHLDHKVKVENGTLSTTQLSQGQRKRLALMTAYLEDRPIYLFDEWAADQDPSFKEIFYQSLLPELKARGKTVIVISHDDHYFHMADRMVKLDYGQIEYDRQTARSESKN